MNKLAVLSVQAIFLAALSILLFAKPLCAESGKVVSRASNSKTVPSKSPSNLIQLPMVRQSTDYTCGVAALQSVFAYFGDDDREDQLAKELKAAPKTGTRYQEMVRLAKARGYAVQVLKKMTIADLRKTIDDGKPVICLLQAWADRPVVYAKDWEDGHYAVAIGHDADNVYFMDPSTLSRYTFIPTNEFAARWHDTDGKEKLEHFGLIIEKSKPKFNRSSFSKME